MALDVAGLQQSIADLARAPGATAAECAQAWADAMQAYASGVVPVSATVDAAAATLSTALAVAFQTPAAAPGMESAFAAFAVTVAAGMTAGGWAGVPPPSPVGFATQFAGPLPSTHDDAGQQIGTLIDTWMKAGAATLIAPPNTPVTWT